MVEKNIRKYAKLMQELGLTGLEIEENGSKLRLERAAVAPVYAPAVQLNKSAEPDNTVSISEKAKKIASGELTEVKSPMIGVFYSAPAENAAPYVKVGDKVKKGDVLCIIEAMKLMNEIVSEEEGTVVEICAGNKQIVDFGHVLFRISK